MGPAQPEETHNPNRARDHLANERTLLAWVRTCIAIIALGFVVARFGLLLRELGVHRHLSPWTSTAFGTALVVCGGALAFLATLRYLRTGQEIERNAYRWSPWLILVLAAGLIIVAVLLAAYLLITG